MSSPVPITWSSATSVSGALSVNSDACSTTGYGFSYVVEVEGTGSGGISGNLYLLVSNGGPYTPLAGSVQSVLVANGANQTFSFSSGTAYQSVKLAWVAGSATAGELLDGDWSITPIPNVNPIPQPAIVVLPGVLASLQQTLSNAYGVDSLCLTDLDPYFSTTPSALPQDVYHLLTEQPGSIFWAPVATFSILNLLSQGFTTAAIATVASMIQAVVGSDERVAQCQCTIVLSGTNLLTATIVVIPQQGQTFQYVVGISMVSITLISVGSVSN